MTLPSPLLVRGPSVNPFPNPCTQARCTRRCFLAALVLALCAVTAPFDGARAAQKGDSADKIVVSGASGGLAREAIEALLERGVKLADLVLVTRTPEKLSSFATYGATVRVGDFDRPETLGPAFAGGRELLLVSTNSSGADRVRQHTSAIFAAVKAGIRYIVYTSFINATDENPALMAHDHQLTEQALMTSGARYTILRNQLYMDGLVDEAAQAIRTGSLYTNAGTGNWAPVARKDCAEVAAIVLTTPGHDGKIYNITGPELINHQELAKIIADVTGKRVRVISIDDATFVARAMQAGMSEATAKLNASLGVAMRTNALNTSSDVLKILLGHEPESLHDMLLHHKTQLLAVAPQLRAY
jgi:NAD(P)H dehydrogenase (quinone)